MVVGIGGFRDIGDPNDPRRRLGGVPQQSNIPGLPPAYDEVVGNPDAPRVVRPEIISAPRKAGSGRLTRLGQAIENAKDRTESDPRLRSEVTELGRLLSGESEFEVVRDPRIERAVGPRKYEPGIDAAQLTRSPADGAQGPNTPLEYLEYLSGLPKESGVRDLGRSDALYYGSSTSEDPFKGSLTGKQSFDQAPYGSIAVPKVQRTGQYLATSGPNKGNLEYSTIYPGDVVASQVGDLDSPYSSNQSREVSLGQLATELKREFETPVIGEEGLQKAYQDNRFTPATSLSAEQVAPYLTSKGEMGAFVGMLERSGGAPQPVYVAYEDGGDQMTTARWIPNPNNPLKGSLKYAEPLYRVGSPFAYDSEAIDAELRPYVGGREVGVLKDRRGQGVGVAKVQQAARGGAQFFLPGERPGDSPIPISAEEIDGTRKLLMVRKDGTQTHLFPRVNKEGVPVGAYRVDDAYEKRYEGPAVMNTYKPAQVGAGNPRTELNRYNPLDRRTLGQDAIGHTQFLKELIKGNSMADPDTANGYRDTLAPMLLRGEISMEQLEQAAPGLRTGTYARQLLDEALTELQVRGVRAEPQFAPSTLETETVRLLSDRPEERYFVSEGEAYDAGLTVGQGSELEGVPITEREERMNAKVLDALGIRDAGAIDLRGSEMAPAQAAYIADVMRRNRSEDSADRLDFQKRGNDSIWTEYPALAAELAREARRNPGEGGRVRKGNLMGGPVEVVQPAAEQRYGSGVTGEQASFARALRDYYQRQAPMPYEAGRDVGDQVSYSQMAAELRSPDASKEDRAMAILAQTAKARQKVNPVNKPPEMGEYLNAPSRFRR